MVSPKNERFLALLKVIEVRLFWSLCCLVSFFFTVFPRFFGVIVSCLYVEFLCTVITELFFFPSNCFDVINEILFNRVLRIHFQFENITPCSLFGSSHSVE